jgi:hypothetical protein
LAAPTTYRSIAPPATSGLRHIDHDPQVVVHAAALLASRGLDSL